LFVAPVFEAEKPCEPEPVEGGACGDEGQDGAEEDADLFLQFGLPLPLLDEA